MVNIHYPYSSSSRMLWVAMPIQVPAAAPYEGIRVFAVVFLRGVAWRAVLISSNAALSRLTCNAFLFDASEIICPD